jgi:hypothetical protein
MADAKALQPSPKVKTPIISQAEGPWFVQALWKVGSRKVAAPKV